MLDNLNIKQSKKYLQFRNIEMQLPQHLKRLNIFIALFNFAETLRHI